MQLLMFYIFGFLALFAAVSMVVSRKPVMSALFLILNMFCLAGLYALLDAHLVAVLQIIVYAGAIMVLVLFVIMLLNLREKKGLVPKHTVVGQVIGILVLATVMLGVIAKLDLNAIKPLREMSPEFGTVAGVAEKLFTVYLLPFEIASVLLLAAIVGAVILAKRKV